MLASKSIIFYCLLAMLSMAACTDKEAGMARAYSAEKKSLACQMERLKLKSDSLWDEIGFYLDKNLPADLPPAERKNMTGIRSAHLLGLFKAFPTLDTAIQHKVSDAGIADNNLAAQMKAVMEKMHEVDKDLSEVLQKIENRSEQQYQQLKQELQEFEKQPCRS